MFLKFPKFLLASLIIAAIIVFILIYFPIPQHWAFESKAELERIRMELPVAETRWKSHNITDYDIDVQVFIHMGMCSTNFNGTPTTLNVRQGRLVVTDEIRKYSLEEGCKIGDLLPPKLFDSVRQILEKAEPDYQYLQIKFDPEYGFVSNYDITANNRISDLHVHYVFSNFRPKAP